MSSNIDNFILYFIVVFPFWFCYLYSTRFLGVCRLLFQYNTSDNKYEYQANVNTIIGSLRDKLAEAVFSRNPMQRERILNRIFTEIQKSVVPIRLDDSNTLRYEKPRKSKFHHNKRSNL